MQGDPHALSAQLVAAATRALAADWRNFNYALFNDRMRAPAIVVSEATSQLGRWIGAQRTMEISRALLLDHPWGTVMEVLKHEMAHQFVDEVLGVRDETSHGPVFHRVCADRAIDATATGIPSPDGAVEATIEAALRRVSKLLALAGS